MDPFPQFLENSPLQCIFTKAFALHTGLILAASGGLDSYLQGSLKICSGLPNKLPMNGCMKADANGKAKTSHALVNGGHTNGMH